MELPISVTQMANRMGIGKINGIDPSLYEAAKIGGSEAVAGGFNALAVNIGGDNIRRFIDRRAVHQKDLLKADAHQLAQLVF